MKILPYLLIVCSCLTSPPIAALAETKTDTEITSKGLGAEEMQYILIECENFADEDRISLDSRPSYIETCVDELSTAVKSAIESLRIKPHDRDSNKTGINRVYYRVYNSNGLQEEHSLTESGIEQTNLLCSNNGRIVWMENDQVMHILLDRDSFLFSDPVIIDSGNCSFPSVEHPGTGWWWGSGFPVVAWIKDDTSVMIRSYDNETGWLEPLTLFTGEVTNLTFCSGIGPLSILTWDYFNGLVWQTVTYDLEDAQIYTSDFNNTEPFNPRFYSGFIPVKGSRYVDVGIMSITFISGDSSIIYTSPFYSGIFTPFEEYQNVSQSTSIVRKPRIHSGKVVGCNHYFINTWEEFVNSHWQIKYSIAHECLSGIENSIVYENIEIFAAPNPIIENTTISFNLNLASDISLKIYNSTGTLIEIVESGNLLKGKHSYVWNSSRLTSGVYLIVLETDMGKGIKKLVVN